MCKCTEINLERYTLCVNWLAMSVGANWKELFTCMYISLIKMGHVPKNNWENGKKKCEWIDLDFDDFKKLIRWSYRSESPK